MKNVHLLPTDKSSRLYLHSENELQLRTNIIRTSEDYLGSNQHIYITSDEEIKEGLNQWYLDKFLNKPRNSSGSQYGEKQDVIILTTDQDLIADGVQAIDDEFLEWFVKNPSCESVEVSFDFKKFRWSALNKEQCYKIIIPKEESFIEYTNTNDCTSMIYNSKEEPKQETLEEAAETNKIPTAEEFLKEESGRWPRSQEVISSIMRDFAKLHVKAALEAAFVKIKEDAMETYGSDVPDCWSDSSILNAYPENLIK